MGGASAESLELVLKELLQEQEGLLRLIESRLPDVRNEAVEEAKKMLLESMGSEEVRDWAEEALAREVMES